MNSGRGESAARVGGVVGELLARSHATSVGVQTKKPDVDAIDRAGATAAGAEAATSAEPSVDPTTSGIRDVLRRFLDLNRVVNQFVDQYVEVLVQQPDGLTPFGLVQRTGRISDSIRFLDRAVGMLLEAADQAQAGPSEPDRNALADYRAQLHGVRESLRAMESEAPMRAANPESRQASVDRLRTLTEEAWRPTTGLFQITSAIVTSLLDQIPQRGAGSGVISAVVTSARDLGSEVTARTKANK